MLERISSTKLVIVVVLIALIIVAGVVVAMAATGTSAPSSRDVAATRTYLRARDALQHELQSDLPATRAATDAFIAKVAVDCPDVFRGAPQESSFHGDSTGFEASAKSRLILEMATALNIAMQQPATFALHGFVGAISHLSWSDGTITGLIQSFASKEAAVLNRRPPVVCGDMKAWVASGYRALPSDTNRAEPRLEAATERLSTELTALGYRARYPERTILQLLKRYQTPGEQRTSDRVRQLEVKLTAAEIKLVLDATTRLESILGLPQCQYRSRRLGNLPKTKTNSHSPLSGCR